VLEISPTPVPGFALDAGSGLPSNTVSSSPFSVRIRLHCRQIPIHPQHEWQPKNGNKSVKMSLNSSINIPLAVRLFEAF
jgi:hypothetical protein